MKKWAWCNTLKEIKEFGVDNQKADGRYPDCKVCRKKNVDLRNGYRKLYPKPDRCDNCGRDEKLSVDHDHETDEFRGWLCSPCNHGIGKIGDNIEGLERAILYLKYNAKKYAK